MPRMGRSIGFIAMAAVVAIGGYIYTKQVRGIAPDGAAPTSTVDVTGVRMDLTTLANAERMYFASNSRYATFEELRSNGDIQMTRNNRPNFTYSVEAHDTSFKIVATYSGPDPKAPKQISIDEMMALRTDAR
jgi:hypothetical protein